MTGGKAAVAAGTGQCEQSRHWTKPPGCGAWGSRSSRAAGRREPMGCWAGRARAAPPWHRRGRGPTGSHGDCGRSSAEKPGGPLTAPLGDAGQDVALAGHVPLTVLLEGPTGVRSHAPRTSTTLPSAVAAARDARESKEGTRKKSLTRVTGTKKGRHVTARTAAAAESERARSPCRQTSCTVTSVCADINVTRGHQGNPPGRRQDAQDAPGRSVPARPGSEATDRHARAPRGAPRPGPRQAPTTV